MARQIKGLILVFLGMSIFFPEVFNLFIFKIVLALVLIWVGINLIFKNDKKNHGK